MTQYMMSVWYPAEAAAPTADELDGIVADVDTLHARLQAEGAWVFGGGLHDAGTATVVRRQDGQAVTTDGPFVETKEQLGGFSVIDVADLDAALQWADQMSAATRCPIEVRPFQNDPTVWPHRLTHAPLRRTPMKQYLMSVHYVEGQPASAGARDPDTMQQIFADVETFNQQLQDAGAWVFAGGLQEPHVAAVVREHDGDILVTDGPFPEAKEQLGGVWIITADDFDGACAWAQKATRACRGPVEVRPFQEEPPE